jgi:type III secretion protein V
MALRQQLSHQYTRGANTLVVYLLDPEIEQALARPEGADPSFPESFRRAAADELRSLPSTAQWPVILTSAEVRAPCARVLEGDFPELAIVSYQDLSPDMAIQPIARISLER